MLPPMTHVIIAIDGPAASGKGSLARKLAQELSYAYLDTGALYRAVGHAVLCTHGNPDDESAAVQTAKTLRITPEDLQNPALRTDETGQAASKVAKFPGVRDALFAFQKDFAHTPQAGFGGVILDGRDIGTVIAPDAHIKLFVTAGVEERSKRRLKELDGRGISTNYATVLEDMRQRDARDSERDTAPLKPADDAHILDTTSMGPEDVLERALSIIREKI